MTTPRKGERVSNYLLEERVGVGSFGEVWRARHHILDTVVAIKIPTDPQFVKNLQREGVAAHRLNHPNVVRVLDLDPYATPPYLVMEYVLGPSLPSLIEKLQAKFPIAAAVTLMRGVLHALSAAHRDGLVHSDIKPGNVLLQLDPAVDYADHPQRLASLAENDVKVTDFGLGRAAGLSREKLMLSMSIELAEARGIAGTLAYMSPEQRDGLAVDARSDIYSCGILLFELLTGSRPQGGELPSSMRPECPRWLDRVYQSAYARLAGRFGSADEMLGAMSVQTAPSSAPPPLPTFRSTSHQERCPSCQGGVDDEDNFCIHCGASLVESAPQCRHCGEFVQRRDRFCIRCGKSLTVLG